MINGEKDTLINEVQYIAGFFAEMQKSASVYTMNDVTRIDDAFAKCLVRVVRDWVGVTYGDPKHILNELVEGLIGKDTVMLFLEAQQRGSDQK